MTEIVRPKITRRVGPEIQNQKLTRAEDYSCAFLDYLTRIKELLDEKHVKKGKGKWGDDWIEAFGETLAKSYSHDSAIAPLVNAIFPAEETLIPGASKSRNLGNLAIGQVTWAWYDHRGIGPSQSKCRRIFFFDAENNQVQSLERLLARNGKRLETINLYSDAVPSGDSLSTMNGFGALVSRTVRLFDYLDTTGAEVLGFIPFSDQEQVDIGFEAATGLPKQALPFIIARQSEEAWHEEIPVL